MRYVFIGLALFAAACSGGASTIAPTSPLSEIGGVAATEAIPAAAQNPVPCGPGGTPLCFNGIFQGNDAVSLPKITQSITGTGTLVGQFSSITKLTLGPSGGTGTGHWIAANGDTIDTTVSGSGVPANMTPCQGMGAEPGDTYNKVTQSHIITGGTGRFAGAQGHFTLTLYHDVVERNGTHGTCGSYSGTITPPGGAH
jgi:hypothetical protein